MTAPPCTCRGWCSRRGSTATSGSATGGSPSSPCRARRRSAAAAGWCPGLVDAHCHVGIALGRRCASRTSPRPASRRSTERAAGVLALRDCGSPVDTRALDDEPDLPRIIRAGRHIAAPRRYIPGLAVEVEPGDLAAEVRVQARRGDGWVKLVGDWIDRGVGDLAPEWPARRPRRRDRRGPRGGRPGHRAHLRHRRAARPDRRRHRLHRARHRADRGPHRRDGRPRHRRRPDAGQRGELPGLRRGGGGEVPGVRQHDAAAVRAVRRRRAGRLRRRACRSSPAPTPAGASRTGSSPTRCGRCTRPGCPPRRRWPRRPGRPAPGWACPASRRARRPTSSSTTAIRGPTSTRCSDRSGCCCAARHRLARRAHEVSCPRRRVTVEAGGSRAVADRSSHSGGT